MMHYLEKDGNGGYNISKSYIALIALITLLITITGIAVTAVRANTIVKETVNDNEVAIVDLENDVDSLYVANTRLELNTQVQLATIIERLDNINSNLEKLNDRLDK